MAEDNNQKIKPKSKKIIFIAAVSLVIFTVSFLVYKMHFGLGKASEDAAKSLENFDGGQKNNKEIFDAEYSVKEGDTLSIILNSLNIEEEESVKIIEEFQKVYSPSKIKIGNTLKIKFAGSENSVEKLEYAINAEKVLIITHNTGAWKAEEKEIAYDIKVASKGNKIASSLFEAGGEIGLSDSLLLLMADIFSGEIDFSTDIREGDNFKIIYEEKYKDGILAMEGNILAAEFQNQGQVFKAFYFEDEGNTSVYFDQSGQSLKKAFLKSPLNYRYISSGYTSSRYHPILKIITSHRAIDYVAAAGTLVVSVADGKVIYAGWNSNGYGNYIGIRHANGYATYYGHLSGFAKGVKVGAAIAQGQTVGYVGSTGFSTGPHLDYSMKKNGAYINPLTVNIVVGDPVSQASKGEFSVHTEKMVKELEKIN